MKTRFKKITSVFLSFLMVVYLFPFGAFAEAATVNTETTEEYTVYRYQDQTCAFTLESWAAGEEKTITDEYQGASFNYYLAVQDSVGNICMDELSASGENISADWIYSDEWDKYMAENTIPPKASREQRGLLKIAKSSRHTSGV